MKPSALFITGWAHGVESMRPMADALCETHAVRIMAGTQVLREGRIPEADHIVAGSMGGLLAMELLPASCRKLVLVSSTARFCSGDRYPCGTPERVLRRMIQQLQRSPEAVLDEFFRNVHFPRKEGRQAAAARNLSPEPVEDLVAGLEYLLRSDLRERVAGIGIPVLLLHGMEDRIIPCDAANWLYETLPESRLRLFESAGHALPAHRFEPVMREIKSFLGCHHSR